MPTGITLFALSAPPAAGAGERVLEFQLQRSVQLAVVPTAMRAPPTDEELRALGCDGWRDEAEAVTLHLPAASDAAGDDAPASGDDAPLLRLVDDDKQAGLTQASLPDLFLRLALRSGGGVSRGVAT